MAALAMSVLSSCNNDDEPALNPDKPTVSAGAYFLCQGQYSSMIEGGLYALDYVSDTMSDDIFKSANGISLGDTPQCGICYGGKIYVGVYGSNCIFVIDKSSYKVKKTVSLVNSTNGQQPRSMVARDGKVYIAMYDGYVARMDTTSMEIDASVKVGPNPEVIGIYNNCIYVPNSDGMNNPNYGTTASVIDLSTFKVKNELQVPLNPYQFEANESGLYLLCKGNYGDVAAQIYKVEGSECKPIAHATIMALGKDNIYYINDPYYGSAPAEYYVYDGKSSKKWEIKPVDAPSNIAVDKIANKIFISSNNMNGQYPSYTTPGYVNEYNINNSFVKKFDLGTGMPCIFFDID